MVWIWEKSKMLRFAQRNGSALVVPTASTNDRRSRGNILSHRLQVEINYNRMRNCVTHLPKVYYICLIIKCCAFSKTLYTVILLLL